MTQKRNSQYDILFEPVQIGPKTAKNRFYQVPHCNGMGHRFPRAMAEMRGVKAEGGWGVVCTEECSIHPTSDLSPATLMRIWDDSDLPVHELMIEKIHEHGALAGIETVTAIGDCLAPATIAIAVHSGHEYARNLDKSPEAAAFFRREVDFGGE